MGLCKAMILVGALILVSTFAKRIHQVNELTPHQPEEMIKHAGDSTMKKTMEQIVEKDQEDFAKASVEEEVYNAQVGNEEEAAADEDVAAVVRAFVGPGLPPDVSAETDAAPAATAAGEGAVEEAEPTSEADPGAEPVVDDEQVAVSLTDMELALELFQQGAAKAQKGKKGKGKDDQKSKGKDKGKGKGQDAGKDKENHLVKGKGKANTKAKVKVLSQGERRLDRTFLPVWNGRWWTNRLTFVRGPFVGFIYQEIPATKTLLIKAWKALEEFGGEAIIPPSSNYVGAKVGDKISFDVSDFVQEGEGKPRPMARNVIIRQRGHAVGEGIVKGPAPTDVRTQVLYYLSDENLRTDKFFHDIISTTEGGWISTDFLLLCRRLKQLGASKKSIMESLQDTPGVEVRDLHGQEAVRRSSPPPPLELGAVSKQSVANAIAQIKSAEAPVLAKKIYTKDMMKSVLDPAVEDREELAEAVWPEADEQKRAPAMAEAEDSETPERQKDRTTKAKRAVKKWAAKRKAVADARHAKREGRLQAKKGEKAKERATADKASAETPAAEKALSMAGQAAVKKSATDSAPKEVAAEKSAAKQTAAETAVKEAAAKPKAVGDARHAKDKARVEAKKGEKAREHGKKAAPDRSGAEEASAKKHTAKNARSKAGQASTTKSATEKATEEVAADKSAAKQAAAETAAKEAAAKPKEAAAKPKVVGDARHTKDKARVEAAAQKVDGEAAWAAKRNGNLDAAHAEDKARVEKARERAKKVEEKAFGANTLSRHQNRRQKAAVKKSAAEKASATKPAAKKALSRVKQTAAKKSATGKVAEAAAAGEALVEQAAGTFEGQDTLLEAPVKKRKASFPGTPKYISLAVSAHVAAAASSTASSNAWGYLRLRDEVATMSGILEEKKEQQQHQMMKKQEIQTPETQKGQHAHVRALARALEPITE